MQARAEARYLRMSPQKARLVIDLIRGQKCGRGDPHFAFADHKRIASESIEKVLRSAIANVENKNGRRWTWITLVVTEAYVNEGPAHEALCVLPRWAGRIGISGGSAHIVVEVAEK